jgi:hypothetical protein
MNDDVWLCYVHPARFFLLITAKNGVQSRVTDCKIRAGVVKLEEISP